MTNCNTQDLTQLFTLIGTSGPVTCVRNKFNQKLRYHTSSPKEVLFNGTTVKSHMTTPSLFLIVSLYIEQVRAQVLTFCDSQKADQSSGYNRVSTAEPEEQTV